MAYLWLKALHIAAVTIWIGGMLLTATIIGFLSNTAGEASGRAAVLDAVRGWDQRVTAPAMLLVWMLGVVLATWGGWFGAPWLTIKLALVLSLSALHGVLSGTLRRLARADGSSAASILRYAPAVTIAGILAIVILVVVKPI
jgi:putative membrane protein